MKGYIKIESATHEDKEGLSIHTDLRDVSYMDRIAAVHGVCQALHITPAELKLMAGLIDSGFMKEMSETRVLEDDTIGGDAKAMLDLLKALLS